ncbi:hypothetical protein OVS_02845 [Mycoplasma ovis str. Michigan]|uniref:Lipoprotein n=1 Tax=Mycoplasma ovis str. Michigan TaxID=1415773 RepID=A0ABM5P1K2_9MOLU|nr:hypothetical protein [Mycoplasma ovis]AHC40365.1 hypothetical protein OVS_02845 [Mycoplasma ovis str. Michigan]
MILSGGALTRGKVSWGCLLFLGFTTFTGLACTEIKGNVVSKALEKIGGLISSTFSTEGSGSQASSQPLDPITPLIGVWESVSGVSTTVFDSISSGYEWIKTSENFQSVTTFFKNFWKFDFVKDIVFNFHLTARAWLGILFDSNTLSKFPDAFKTFKILSAFLSKNGKGDKDMINWLYLRLLVNPRRMITILSRSQKHQDIKDENSLKCNGPKKKKPKKATGTNLPLGICFICQSSNKLIDHVVNFLKEGKMPEETQKKEK